VNERVSQRGYSPFEKGHNLPGRQKIIIDPRKLVLVGLKAATYKESVKAHTNSEPPIPKSTLFSPATIRPSHKPWERPC